MVSSFEFRYLSAEKKRETEQVHGVRERIKMIAGPEYWLILEARKKLANS